MIDPEQIEGKAQMFIDFEDRLTIFDTLILCRFYRDLYPWEALAGMVHAVTGLPVDTVALRSRAAAIATLVRRFNIREGLSPQDDKLPPRLHQRLAGSDKTISEAQLDTMVQDYYRLRGWNASGIPPQLEEHASWPA